MMLRYAALAVMLGLCQAMKLAEWIDQTPPSQLKKTMKLKKHMKSLLNSMGVDDFYILILPENKAWDASGNLYKRLETDTELAREIMTSAVVQVDKPVHQVSDLKGMTLQTLSGTPVVVEGDKVWYGVWKGDKIEKHGKSLPIKKKPIKLLEDASIFTVSAIALPDDVQQMLNN